MMKKVLALVVVFAALVSTTAFASESTKAILASYLQIHAALSADKTDSVKPAAQAIAREAARMGAGGEAMVNAAKAMESAGDLKAARAALGPLSDAVIAAAAADDWKDLAGVKIGFCPMVNKSWIQKDGKVNNPYYGSQMLTCGQLKDVQKDVKK